MAAPTETRDTGSAKPQTSSGMLSEDFWAEEAESYPGERYEFISDTTITSKYVVSHHFLNDGDPRSSETYRQKTISVHPWNHGKYYDWEPKDRFYRRTSLANADLDLQANIQDWRNAVAQINRSNIYALEENRTGLVKPYPGDFTREQIPLFRDNSNGDEYQVGLAYPGKLDHSLSEVHCERHLQDEANISYRGYYRLREGQHADLASFSMSPIPSLIWVLGVLVVRHRSENTDGGYVTEKTDYNVLVDAGSSNDLSVWIAASRSEIVERDRKCRELYPESRCLPIFEGGMNNDQGGYDIACILPSIRHLATAPTEENLDKNFRDACELVRKTRANVDPYLFVLKRAEAASIMNNPPT